MTQKQDQLEFDTTLDILNPKDGSPMRARNPVLVDRLRAEYKPGRGEEQVYSMLNWKGPTVKKLGNRRLSSVDAASAGSDSARKCHQH